MFVQTKLLNFLNSLFAQFNITAGNLSLSDWNNFPLKILYVDIKIGTTLTSLLWVQYIDDFSGKFRTMHVILIVEPWLMKISPAIFPSGTPRIWVMGSKKLRNIHLPKKEKSKWRIKCYSYGCGGMLLSRRNFN